MKKSGRWWYKRLFTSANSWAEVVDIGAMREVLENALQTRIGRQRQNAVLCELDPLLVALETVAAAVEAPESSPSLPLDFPILPSPRYRIGSAVAVGGLVSRADFGGVQIAWHDFSTATEDLGIFNVEYSITLEPFELGLASAVTQIALPGRAELARARLLQHVLAPEATTTPLPPAREIYKVGPQEGYPSWLINQMLEMEGAETLDAEEKARSASLIADAATRKRIRMEMEAEARATANAASGLPEDSKDLLLGVNVRKDYSASPILGIFSGACRSGVVTIGGEIIGQLLGDCVRLDSSAELVNSVELCTQLKFSAETLQATVIGQYAGVVLDFAELGTVPTNYTITLPPPIPSEAGEIPGEVAEALWRWDSSLEWGRQKSFGYTFAPMNLETWTRKDDTQICAKVFQAGLTYCPIARLNSSFYGRLPRKPGSPEFPSPDSTCPSMDALLDPIQEEQVSLGRTGVKYVPLESAVSSSYLMNDEQMYKNFQMEQTDLGGLGCPYGRSLQFQEGSYRCK